MSFIQSKQRIWLDLVVAVLLLSLLGFGTVYIYRLNNDARELSFDTEQAMKGQQVSTDQGCIACHTLDGSLGIGPSWKGMWGRTETLKDGTSITVDEDYFVRSLSNPAADIVQGYPNVMLRYFLEDEEILALIDFAKSISTTEKDL